MPASRIGFGVVKSGSPMPSEITSFMVASISKHFRMPEGLSPATRFDRSCTSVTSCIAPPTLVGYAIHRDVPDSLDQKPVHWRSSRGIPFRLDLASAPRSLRSHNETPPMLEKVDVPRIPNLTCTQLYSSVR